MPIKPENLPLYPHNWRQIRDAIVSRDKNKCKSCGLPNYRYVFRHRDEPVIVLKPCADYGEAIDAMKRLYPEREFPPGRLIKVILTVAHLNHDPSDNRFENLAAMCQQCHLRYDKHQHMRNAARTRDRKRGQMRFEDFVNDLVQRA